MSITSMRSVTRESRPRSWKKRLRGEAIAHGQPPVGKRQGQHRPQTRATQSPAWSNRRWCSRTCQRRPARARSLRRPPRPGRTSPWASRCRSRVRPRAHRGHRRGTRPGTGRPGWTQSPSPGHRRARTAGQNCAPVGDLLTALRALHVRDLPLSMEAADINRHYSGTPQTERKVRCKPAAGANCDGLQKMYSSPGKDSCPGQRRIGIMRPARRQERRLPIAVSRRPEWRYALVSGGTASGVGDIAPAGLVSGAALSLPPRAPATGRFAHRPHSFALRNSLRRCEPTNAVVVRPRQARCEPRAVWPGRLAVSYAAVLAFSFFFSCWRSS